MRKIPPILDLRRSLRNRQARGCGGVAPAVLMDCEAFHSTLCFPSVIKYVSEYVGEITTIQAASDVMSRIKQEQGINCAALIASAACFGRTSGGFKGGWKSPFLFWVTISGVATTPKSGNGKGAMSVEYLIAFGISVVAGVVANYLSKWLDGEDSDNRP